jgi:NodT family efflux transporter outer membrane factor (OMF) lipoprotein
VRPEAPANPAWLDAELEEFDTDSAELAEWWRTLNDPVLDELIETARRENNNLRIAGLRVLESQARLNIAVGNKYPQQQVLAGDITAIGVSETAANSATTDTSFTEFNVGASVVWEIDFWGRFRRGIEAADADLLASIASYDDAMVLVTAQVADVYALIRATEEQLRLANESYEIQKRSYEITEILFRNGSSSELDALQAKTQLLGTAAVIPSLETSLRQLKNALSVLLGRTPGDMTDILKGEGKLPDIPESISVDIPANMLRQRPDVRRAELQALAQNARVGVAQADLYPSFTLTGSLGLSAAEGTSSTGGADQLFDTDSRCRTHDCNKRLSRIGTPCYRRRAKSRMRWPPISERRRRTQYWKRASGPRIVRPSFRCCVTRRALPIINVSCRHSRHCLVSSNAMPQIAVKSCAVS